MRSLRNTRGRNCSHLPVKITNDSTNAEKTLPAVVEVATQTRNTGVTISIKFRSSRTARDKFGFHQQYMKRIVMCLFCGKLWRYKSIILSVDKLIMALKIRVAATSLTFFTVMRCCGVQNPPCPLQQTAWNPRCCVMQMVRQLHCFWTRHSQFRYKKRTLRLDLVAGNFHTHT